MHAPEVATYYYNTLGISDSKGTMPAEGGRSFSSSVMIRVLRILLENGELRRSNLCSKAGLNYKVCTRYVNFLAQLRWVAIRKPSDQTMIISISEEGVANLRKLEFQDLTDDFDREAGKTLQNPSDNRVWPNADTRTLGSVKRKPLAKGDVYARSPGKKVVVIIDDDEAALATYAAFLENYKNLEVQKFSDSRKALEHLTLNSGKCDLILLDIRMPGLSGLRLCQAVKATSPAVRIIFISSLDAGSELADMFPDPTLGTRNFLRKPIGRANFIDTVTRALS